MSYHEDFMVTKYKSFMMLNTVSKDNLNNIR